MISVKQYRLLANGASLSILEGSGVKYYHFDGLLMPKERPRLTKGGKAFTPAATRAFEKTIKAWGTKQKAPLTTYPIRVSLELYEKGDDIPHSYPTRGDIDNIAKAILDALNKVFYKDDKQIAELHLKRWWAETPGFAMGIQRIGLSKSELNNFLKFRKVAT